MNKRPIPSMLFVTGTDTGVGKTVVCSVLMAGLRGLYYKPVQSGLRPPTDTQRVQEMTGLPPWHFAAETYRLKEPLSPHLSAALDDVHIDLESFCLPQQNNVSHLIAEGAGGIMVPLSPHHFMLDLMKRFALPVLLVASSRLGTINHTLLSLEQLRRHQLDVYGVVVNGPNNDDNCQAIEAFGRVRVVARIPPMDALSPEALLNCFDEQFRAQ
jgi:dethiobiotin synthase